MNSEQQIQQLATLRVGDVLVNFLRVLSKLLVVTLGSKHDFLIFLMLSLAKMSVLLRAMIRFSHRNSVFEIN